MVPKTEESLRIYHQIIYISVTEGFINLDIFGVR